MGMTWGLLAVAVNTYVHASNALMHSHKHTHTLAPGYISALIHYRVDNNEVME